MAKSQNFTFTPRARWSELNKPFAIFYSDSHSNFLNKQANAFAVPFCFARHGLLSKSVCKDDNTALYIAVFKRSLGPFQAATLDAALARNRAGFAVLSRPGGRPESPILLDHTCLCDTWTFFYLQENRAVEVAWGPSPWRWHRCARRIWGDDLSQGPYFVETNKSPLINLLFAALFNPIVCSTTKIGLLIPSAVEGRDLDAITTQSQLHWRFQWRASASTQDLSWGWCWNTASGCWTRAWRLLH